MIAGSVLVASLPTEDIDMTNLEVAQCMVANALAYAKSGDLATVEHNLEYIQQLLETPDQKNPDHDWEDFK